MIIKFFIHSCGAILIFFHMLCNSEEVAESKLAKGAGSDSILAKGASSTWTSGSSTLVTFSTFSSFNSFSCASIVFSLSWISKVFSCTTVSSVRMRVSSPTSEASFWKEKRTFLLQESSSLPTFFYGSGMLRGDKGIN